jgi:hypothetical protein
MGIFTSEASLFEGSLVIVGSQEVCWNVQVDIQFFGLFVKSEIMECMYSIF